MISGTAAAVLYVIEVLYTAALWAFCAEGLYPPRGRRIPSYLILAGCGMTPVFFLLWFPAGTDAFYLTGTLSWLLGMLLETVAYCLLYEGAWAGKVGWYLAAFWAMNEAETLPWSVYMATNEGQMGAYGVFSTLRTPWDYLPVAAAYFAFAVLIRFLLRLLHRLLPKQGRFATVLCVLALAGTAALMESDVIYMEVTARDGAMHGLGGVYILEGLSAILLLTAVLLILRVLHHLDVQRELRETDRERQRQDAYFRSALAESDRRGTQKKQESEILQQTISLLENGKLAETQQLLQAAGIPKTESTVTYTSNHVVNAVLSEIERCCREEDVDFSVRGNLPDQTRVADIDLSALVGNLLTNALEACGRLPRGTARRISLRFVTGGDNLLVSCENSAAAARIDFGRSAKAAAGHGYGSRIIDYVAQKYGGRTERVQKDGEVSVTAMLTGVLSAGEAAL